MQLLYFATKTKTYAGFVNLSASPMARMIAAEKLHYPLKQGGHEKKYRLGILRLRLTFYVSRKSTVVPRTCDTLMRLVERAERQPRLPYEHD